MLDQAEAAWLALVPDADFRGVSVALADLEGLTLGEARGRAIVIDPTAAGWGWSTARARRRPDGPPHRGHARAGPRPRLRPHRHRRPARVHGRRARRRPAARPGHRARPARRIPGCRGRPPGAGCRRARGTGAASPGLRASPGLPAGSRSPRPPRLSSRRPPRLPLHPRPRPPGTPCSWPSATSPSGCPSSPCCSSRRARARPAFGACRADPVSRSEHRDRPSRLCVRWWLLVRASLPGSGPTPGLGARIESAAGPVARMVGPIGRVTIGGVRCSGIRRIPRLTVPDRNLQPRPRCPDARRSPVATHAD